MPHSAASGLSVGSSPSRCDREGASGPSNSPLVGVSPIPTVLLLEDHDGAYDAWRQAELRERILIHIDAHIDWDWITDQDPRDLLNAQSLHQVDAMLDERVLWNLDDRSQRDLVHIGNYVSPALREGLVREFFWVLPDSVLSTPQSHRTIARLFHNWSTLNPRDFTHVRVEPRRVTAVIHGRQVTACGLSDLPSLSEPVLLDIDTDFLTTEFADDAGASDDCWKQLPWIWPEELIAALTRQGIRSDFVTIAYSVEGGFTPLSYKYLGDELALRLRHPALPAPTLESLAHKRTGALFRHQNDLDRAIAEFEAAANLAPQDASCQFNLAYLYDYQGAYQRAMACYRRAVQLDPTYATAYNHFGATYETLGNLDKAKEECGRILRWDPRNADAHQALADLLVQTKDWDSACSHYREAIALQPDHAAAHRGLGHLYLQRGPVQHAIMHLQRSIALRPSAGMAYCWLGEAFRLQQRRDDAVEAFRGALRCGLRTVEIYRKLGTLYWTQRRFVKAWKQYRKSLALQGWLLLRFFHQGVGAFGERLSRAFARPRRERPALGDRTNPPHGP